jgi:hypothetical protein
VNGLELAEEYYHTYGVEMISTKFGPYAANMAIGLAGPGSECFGFDDEISRDHDWGPGFCIWLTKDDFKAIGEDLQKAYLDLPRSFLGFGPRMVSPGEEHRTGVAEITTFYRTYTGFNQQPKQTEEWLSIPEQYLATCTNGKVFSDHLGEFTEWRQMLLDFYPEDVRLKKLASRCITAAQAGQYNLLRSLKRSDHFAARYAEMKFCADIISLVFMLNKRYTPFYKWMHRAVEELPVLGKRIYALISDLGSTTELQRKTPIIEEMCAAIIRELRQEGLSDSGSDFLLDHASSIHQRISDPALRCRLSVID